MSLTTRVIVRCDMGKCRSKAYAVGHIGADRHVFVVYPKGWRHIPVVDQCPKRVRAHKRYYAKIGKPDPYAEETRCA